MELEDALATAARLRAAIATELEGARGERQLLRSLDASGLFARASARSAFLADTAHLERDLSISLARVTGALGIRELSLEQLRSSGGAETAALADVLSEIRALAGALREIDHLNLELARRALGVVRGYVEALHPAPRAYDRHGGRAITSALAVVASKG